MNDLNKIDNLLKTINTDRLVFQFFPERKTYQFEARLYKSKVWTEFAHGRTAEEALRRLITRLTVKGLYNGESKGFQES